MGRTLEGLTRATGRRAEPDPSLPPPVIAIASRPETIDPDSIPADDDTIPYIEVGGPKAGNTSSKLIVSDAIKGEPVSVPALERTVFAAGSLIYFPVSFQPAPFPPRVPTGRTPTVAREIVAFHQPGHAISGQYRSLWEELIGPAHRTSPRILVFMSPAPGAGTTTVVLNLGFTAARDPEGRVLVIDADRRSPAIADRLGVPGTPGLWDWLGRPFPLGLALQETALANLHILPAGSVPSGQAPHSERLVLLTDQLRQRFDWVLVDAGVWNESDAASWARRGDGAYLVLGRPDADAAHVGRAHEEVVRAGGPLKGYILTGN